MIEKILTDQKASEIAKQKAQSLADKLQKGDDVTADLANLGVSFESKKAVTRQSNDVAPAIVKKAFVLAHPKDGHMSVGTATLANGDLAVVQVEVVNSGADVAIQNPAMTKQLMSQLAQSAYQSYVESLKHDAKIVKKHLKVSTNN